jgi:DnaJ-class molecular chaperone
MFENNYKIRKEERRKAYQENHGRKLEKCNACNGSGRYDHNGSPKCGACGGTGKTLTEPTEMVKIQNMKGTQ